MDVAFQQCMDPDCRATFGVEEVHVNCPACAKKNKNSLLDICYDWSRLPVPKSLGADKESTTYAARAATRKRAGASYVQGQPDPPHAYAWRLRKT